MRKLPAIAAILALAIMPGMAAAQQSPSQAQAAGKALGAASLQTGRLTPAESNKAAQTAGASNVWGSSYSGNPDSNLTAKQSEPSMIGIGNKAINESVSSFQGYNTSRDEQASQATYFLNKNPVLKPTISPQDPMIPAAHSGVGTQVFASSSTTECKQVDVTTPRDPNEKYSCRETYNPYVVPCSNDSIASFNSIPAPDISANISSYYCPSGQVLSGSTCTATTITQQPATITTSCPAGWQQSGSICTQTSSYPATYNTGCPAGYAQQGNSCVMKTGGQYAAVIGTKCPTNTPSPMWLDAFAAGSIDDNGHILCVYNYPIDAPGQQCGGAAYFGGRNLVHSYPTFVDGVKVRRCVVDTETGYTCPSGGILEGSTCYNVSNVPLQPAGYSCPNGGTLSGSACYTTSTTSVNTDQNCPSGATLSGGTCYTTTTANTSANPNYYCPSGYILRGNMCTGKMVDQFVSKELNGCGALEGLAQ